MNAITCENCGYAFDLNAPGVSTDEAPYFTHRPDDSGRTRYLCSTVCMAAYLDTCAFSDPRGERHE